MDVYENKSAKEGYLLFNNTILDSFKEKNNNPHHSLPKSPSKW